MPRKASPWAIYEKEMTACDLGIPLWEPNPPYVDDTPRYERIEPGDVGVLQSGSFELLFNVFLDSDHERQRYFGVPSDFKPLRLPGPQDRTGERVVATAAPLRGTLDAMPLKTENVIYHGGSVGGSAAPAVPFDVGAKFDFELSKESGAVLLFNKPARRYEMGQSDHLEQHIRVNYKSWMRFAREQGYSVYQSRLYVVTGVIRTSQWAMATWNSSSKSFGAKASLSISGVGDASVAYRGHWSSSNKTVITNQGPAIDTLGGTDNQTLFFSTLAIRARRLFPAKIRAAAGPHVLGSGDRDVSSAPGVLGQNNEDEDVEILRIPGSAKDSDVLAPLLDYILDSCPDAEAALARDSDLMPYLLGRYDDVAIKKNLKLFAPDITVTDGVGSLNHRPYSVMLRQLIDHLINVEREPQNIQELLAIVQIIAILPKLLPGNKLVARQVGEWCSELAFFARQYPNANPEAIAEANRVARNIVTEMHVQSPPGGQVRIIAIIRRSEMEERLSYCLRQIQEICRRFQLRTHSRIEDFDMAVQVNAFQELNYQDHIATMEELSDTSGFNALVAELDGERDAKRLSAIHLGLAQVMQNGLEVYSAGDAKRVSLAVNLYEVLRRSQELLPDLELCHGEVERVGTSPVSGGPKYDEWEGRYLSSEQVRIKVFRTYLPTASGDVASPDKYQRRFQRESEIWYETWKKDRGKYLVPFYGYSVTDTGGPYMVSPYYPRTADVYVKQASGIDHLALLHDIAKGVEVLHTMDPPVIHGCIKGSNVFIASDGTVRLGNFGFSKLMEDVMGEPYTATGTSQEEVRWRPPERWQGQGILSIEGDIWELGMTMLELLSHEKPWKEFRHAGPVLAAVQSGSRPARPGDPEVLERGLTDELWMVMQACWATERQDRPKIGEVLAVVSGRRGVAMT